ncbi:hypothetical protein [Streptomyces alfalfae]
MTVNVHLGDEEGLDRSRRYLKPVASLDLPAHPDEVHLAVYEWLPQFEAWATGPGLCGSSTMQGPLPEGAEVTCVKCREWRPRYERMLAPGYRPEDDDPEVLRKQVEASRALLGEFLALADVTHRYASMGGHDVLGENLSCSGCELARRVREHLEEYG